MEISKKLSKEKIIKTFNKKTFIYKSPLFNKYSNKSKHNAEIINFLQTNYKDKIIYNNLKKYNTSSSILNKYIINDIIFDHRNHIVALFKNYLLWDETSEFLKRYYMKKDIFGRLPKISEYYEHYTLFSPNYLANDGLLLIIMIKWIRRKKKYLQYLEEKEEQEKSNKHKKNLNKNFEPLINDENLSLSKNRSKSFFSSCVDLSKNTLELTILDNEICNNKRKNSENKKYKNKNNQQFNMDEEFKNSVSFTEIFDDLSSHFSVLINNNNNKNWKLNQMSIKNLENKKIKTKKEINLNNNSKKVSIKQKNQKSLSKKISVNKQQNIIKKEKEAFQIKIKEIHKTNKVQKKSNIKKSAISKEKNKIENDKNNENNKENNKLIANNFNNKETKKFQKVSIVNINLRENKENKDINNLYNNNNASNKEMMKNINILNGNSSKSKKILKGNDENLNTINTIANINQQYYSLGKLIKNIKQGSAIKKMNMKSLNLLNFNPNIIPNLKKIVSKQKDKKIIFPRNYNLMYNNNTNKLNTIKRDNFEQMKLLTDRDKDKENNKMIINTNENSKYIKLNDNTSIYNNISNNNSNVYYDQNELFAKKVSKLIKKKHISLMGDNLSFKEPNNSNILIYKNDKNDKTNINNISNLNNLRYKKNSVLRQFNSKRDFNFSNSKNNILQNYNNISNNSISSSSSSLIGLNQKKRLSSYLSQNSSINKKKSMQKINLNLNLQINFNINLDKKNKKLILGKRLNNRIFNEITNNKNLAIQNILKNDKNNNSNNISVPLTQRYYYKVNHNQNYLGEKRSSSSSNSKTKKRIKN